MQQITEKRIYAVAPQALTTDGDQYGKITVADVSLFRVGQEIRIQSSTQPELALKIKRIYGTTDIYLGPLGKSIKEISDVTVYTVADGAFIFAYVQPRPAIPEQEIERLTYEEEPVIARRCILVDKYGNKIQENNPLPVVLSDGSINIGTVNAEVEVQLSHKDNYPDIGDVADSVQIGDGTDVLAINPDGSINVSVLPSTGTPIIAKLSGSFIDANETIIATYVTPQNNTNLLKFMLDAATYGTFKIYVNAMNPVNLIAMTKTSGSQPSGAIEFKQPEKIVSSGTTILVTFMADSYRTRKLGASGSTFVRLEAFY